MRKLLLLLCGLFAALLLFHGAANALDIPAHGGQWVVDNARLLTAAEKNGLAESLRGYAEQSGNQIVVLTIPGLQGEDIAAYANRVAREWGVGQKDKNNGVLILVAQAEHKVRFEIGRGIEDRIPDLRARRIQQEITVPLFKAGRYAQGFTQSVAAIRQALGDEAQAAGPETPAQGAPAEPPTAGGDSGFPLFTLGLILLVVLLAVAYYRRNGSRFGPSSGSGGNDSSFLIGLVLGILSSIFRGRGGGGFGGGDGGGDGGFSGGGGDFGGGGSSGGFGGDD